MRRYRGFALCATAGALLVALSHSAGGATAPTESSRSAAGYAPIPLIVDTDIAGDADDAGALAMLNVLDNRRRVRILGVMAGSPSEWSAPAVDAINTYYGNGDVPIGTQRPPYLGHLHNMATYQHVAENFPNDLQTGGNAPESTDLYREILAAQPDHSVTIASIGLLTNLQRLVESGPDEHSPLDGYDLVSRKVRLLSVMGGAYPDSRVHPSGHEHNFDRHAAASAVVIEQWPTRTVFAGWELGQRIATGARLLEETPAANPVREVYTRFGFHSSEGRASWDHVAAWYAACGTGGLFDEEGTTGSNTVAAADGSNAWVTAPERDHAYLVATATNEKIEDTFEDLMVAHNRGAGGHPAACR